MMSRRSIPLGVLALCVAACGPSISQTRAAPQVVIRLTQTPDTTAGCIDVTPSPGIVGEGQPFRFENTTSVDLELMRLDNDKTFTKIRAGQQSPSLIVQGVGESGRISFYSKACMPSFTNALGEKRYHYQIRSLTVRR